MEKKEMKKLSRLIVKEAGEEKLSEAFNSVMTFDELQWACSLYKCKLSQTEDKLLLEFPDAKIELAKDFNVRETEACMFAACRLLNYIRWFFDKQKERSEP